MAQNEVCKMGYDFPFGQSRSLAVSGRGSVLSYNSLGIIFLLCYGEVDCSKIEGSCSPLLYVLLTLLVP